MFKLELLFKLEIISEVLSFSCWNIENFFIYSNWVKIFSIFSGYFTKQIFIRELITFCSDNVPKRRIYFVENHQLFLAIFKGFIFQNKNLINFIEESRLFVVFNWFLLTEAKAIIINFFLFLITMYLFKLFCGLLQSWI